MKEHAKKIVAPILVVVGIGVYYTSIAWVFINLAITKYIKVIVILVSVGVTILLITVLVERIKEIMKGEEDDLSQY